MIDPITDSDLMAFIDGQLDVMRRLEVEDHLGRNPETAARVMAEMHDRDALRAAFSRLPTPGPERNRQAARRLDRSLRWGRIGARLKRAAAIVVLVGAGWLAHDEVGSFGVPGTFAATIDPTLVEDAQQAREVARLRAGIASQRSAAYDRDAIATATGIRLPAIPAEWTVRDVQVFPSRHGTGVEIALDAGADGEISLFATQRRATGAAMGPAEADGAAIYWSVGNSAYAVSGGRDDTARRHAVAALSTGTP